MDGLGLLIVSRTRRLSPATQQPSTNHNPTKTITETPTQDELNALQPGAVVERTPARPPARAAPFGQQPKEPEPDPFEGTREALTISPAGEGGGEGGGGGGEGEGEGGEPLLDRRDVWGWSPPASGRPPNMRNLRFDN